MTMPASVTREFQKLEAAERRAARSAAALEPITDDDRILENLAAMSDLEYERERENAAKSLGCRTNILDKLVAAKRPKNKTDDLQGRALNLPELKPWPEAINGAELLTEISERFSAYTVLPNGAADTLALWVAHTHCYDAFLCSPRLNITSPDKQCGKTTLRDVIAQFVPRPMLAENLSTAVFFRVIEKYQPTVLADEVDTWLKESDELRGAINAGHRRGGQFWRCEGDGNDARAFSVSAPAVLCGIGSLPGTIYDRSIVIRLERAKPGEVCEPFDSRRTRQEQELCRKLARFCSDYRPALENCDPKLPPGVFNRLADNWRPLFAVAQIAGGDWPDRAAAAYSKLTARNDEDAQGIGTMLLADIRAVFQAKAIFSKTLVEKLIAMPDRPWLEARRDKPINERWLARRLATFDVHPDNVRVGDDQAKGYKLSDLAEAFERYLPELDVSKRPNVPEQENSGPEADSNRPSTSLWDVSKRPNGLRRDGTELQDCRISTGLGRWDGKKQQKRLPDVLVIPASCANDEESNQRCIDAQRV